MTAIKRMEATIRAISAPVRFLSWMDSRPLASSGKPAVSQSACEKTATSSFLVW
jgi:hypothetical protein